MNGFRLMWAVVAFTLFLACAGCATQPTGNANSNTTTNTANTTTKNAPASDASRARANNLPVTLPVLDALFYEDESFKAALKDRLGLNDNQIAQLQKIAREETAKLN